MEIFAILDLMFRGIMNQVYTIIDKYGKDFEINDNWYYHSTRQKNIVNIFKYGILSKKILSEMGLRHLDNFTDYDSMNGLDYISLSINKNIPYGSYETFSKNNVSVIVDDSCPVIAFREYEKNNRGIKRIFKKKDIVKVSISSFQDEVQVKHKVDRKYLLGLKIGNNLQDILNIACDLYNNGIDIYLYDFNMKKKIKCSELLVRCNYLENDREISDSKSKSK